MAERELLQWTWAWPPRPRVKTEEPLEVQTLMARQSDLPRTQLPADVVTISAGVDARKERLEWFVVASRESGGPLCIDYGWQVGTTGENRSADIVLLDCHWETDALYEACWQHQSWMPVLGFGFKQHRATYHSPKNPGKSQPVLGDAWHLVEMSRAIDGSDRSFRVAEMNADVWKSRLHRALSVEAEHPQALLLPKSSKENSRRELAKHLTAEKQVSEYVAGKGNVLKWVSTYYKNHWLDAAYMALVGQSVLSLGETQPRTFQLPMGARGS